MKGVNKFMNTKKIVLNCVAILIAIFVLLPLLWMLIVSLKPNGNAAVEIKDWFNFSDLTISNYVNVITTSNIFLWTFNSFIIGVITTVICVFTSSLAAYGFSKKHFKLKPVLYLFVVSGLLIPTEAIMVPLYDTVLHLNLIDNMWGIILPGLTNPLGIILMKQFMDGIPNDYIEAARLEGCSDFAIWRKICLPLTKSAMVSIGIFYFVLSWNNFIWPYIAINSEENMVLATGLPTFLGSNAMQINTIMAASAIAAIPTIIVFLILQKHIIKGVAMSGIKG
jgi:multiple sugar transport system permease protein